MFSCYVRLQLCCHNDKTLRKPTRQRYNKLWLASGQADQASSTPLAVGTSFAIQHAGRRLYAVPSACSEETAQEFVCACVCVCAGIMEEEYASNSYDMDCTDKHTCSEQQTHKFMLLC